MGHIDLFGAYPGARPGCMTSGNSFVAVENLQTFLAVIFSGVHQADNRRQHCIGAQKSMMAADTGACAAKAVYTARRLDILLQMFRRYVMGFSVRERQGIDDIWFYPINVFISLFDVYGEIPYDRGHLDGVNSKGRRLEFTHCGLNEQFASQQGLAVDADGTASTLAVFTRRVPGQRGVLRVVDLSEKIDETLNATGFYPICPAAGNLCLRVKSMDFQCQGICVSFFHGFNGHSD